VAASNPEEREMEGNEKETGEKKWERSNSVSQILRDGTNPHIGGIFSREPLRSRRSPSKQPLLAHYNNLGLKKLLSPPK
jgi:hypothetical protein